MTSDNSVSNSFLRLVFLSVGICSSFYAHSRPEIVKHEGSVSHGGIITLEGNNFTSKKNNKPMFVWRSDNGKSPMDVGRKNAWSGDFNGEASKEIVAPNSRQSFRYDHGLSSSPALAGLKFNSDELYVYRRNYENFDLSKDFAIRTRVSKVKGNIKSGQTVKGERSGATGIIDRIKKDGKRYEIFYSLRGGSINDSSPTDFEYGETMHTETAILTNSEGSSKYPTGTYRTFNFKTFRLWNTKYKNNIHVGAGRDQKFNILPEATDGMFWADDMTKTLAQKPFEWKTEEIYYRSSDIGEANGVLDFLVNGEKFYNHEFQMRNNERIGPYNKVYQSQVSNGAQSGSFIYYDTVYIDDSWNHVLACKKPTYSKCGQTAIQIPLQWSDDSIKIIVDYGLFDKKENLYFYVFDKHGKVNNYGYLVNAEL